MLLETICTSARSLKTMGSHGRTFFPPGAQGNRALQLWDSRRGMESERLYTCVFEYLSINMHSMRLNLYFCMFSHRILTCTLNVLHGHALIINKVICKWYLDAVTSSLSMHTLCVERICALICKTFCEEIHRVAPTSCPEGSFAAV